MSPPFLGADLVKIGGIFNASLVTCKVTFSLLQT